MVNENLKINTVNKYQYFTIPLLLKYNFGKSKSFFSNAGVFFGPRGKDKKTTKITNTTTGYSYEVQSNGNYNFPLEGSISGPDYGFSLGVGKVFKLSSELNLSIELRNNLGLANLVEGINVEEFRGNIKSNTIMLLTEISFDL
ncbi:hypothetical protein J2X31_001782 [Flavobacterium arsenatis]|uniref:Outer membrane protein beta-barrel domain-containing protein n=1 Tax=Flavobacterium arsenatis TaxID=1484332 RepID=A0ABU1TP85_9FLAO|nr:outer membrane beta-barrel protein [Flavobacterium arsenatis]MDR6967770.1 hypothetical protein [Flavobacterium arsenatis]